MAKQDQRNRSKCSLFLALLAVGGLFYRFGPAWLRSLLLYLSTAEWARDIVSNQPLAWRVASRFVAGETMEEALAVAQELNKRGLLVTLDHLGENIASIQDTFNARDEILRLLDLIAETSVNANVSVKLSQLGLRIDEGLATDNVRALLERAKQHGNKIRIDMEESALTDPTLRVYRTLRDKHGFGHRVGIVIQAYLYRSQEDITQLITEGAWVRLCKGAYAEPPEVAYPDKRDTDASYIRLMQALLSGRALELGVYPAIATHDERMIRETIRYVTEHNIPPDAFEFQMLYGIRRELQESLAAQGYQVRIYIPYGTALYPYFVRRLAERPANLWFFLANLFRR